MKEQTDSWYVMSHLKPEQVEKMLLRELDDDGFRVGERGPLSFKYFIPFLFVKRRDLADEPEGRSVREQVRDIEFDQHVREALHRYIFIQADETTINRLVYSVWNTTGVLRLTHMRSLSGERLVVSDAEMAALMSTIRTRHVDCQIEAPYTDPVEGDTVNILKGPWKGHKATITRVKVRKGRLYIEARVNILGQLASVHFNDLREGDVSIESHAGRRLLKGDILSNFEDEMEHILARDDDYNRTRNLYVYRDAVFEKEDAQRKFIALMLICAHLLKQHDVREQLIEVVQSWVPDATSPRNEQEAYLALSLFVATHDPVLREGVRKYLRKHPNYSGVVVRFFAKAKRIRVRR